ncbi:MAG TPA: nucleotide exchange factor GrpE [Syntrophales bacterium]|nr:nucleotide exchange factor GrpE [Syntrophales bacterium]
MGSKSKNRKEHEAAPPREPQEAPQAEKAAEGDQGKPLEAEDLRASLEAKEKEAAENYDRYLRAMAEMDNFRKRAARDKEDAIKYGNEKLIKDILPILDSLDRALHQASEMTARNNFEAFQQGLQLIHSQILGCLERHGVVKVAAKGEEFDPDKHQALMQVETPEMESNRVVDEYESGYTLHGRLLRPSKVSVSKNVPKEDEGQ